MIKQKMNLFSRSIWVCLLVAVSACSGSGNEPNTVPTVTITPTATPQSNLPNIDGQAYRVFGESNNVSFSGEICSLNEQFFIDGTYPGGSARTVFIPGGDLWGITSMSGGGSDCTQFGEGTYFVTIYTDGSGTITWTDTATMTCPGMNNTRTATFELPLQPATDLPCP
jgi:hypothetical protein